jgi:pimeloyl-ACP methyl ester carboxylesterase
MNVHDRSAYFPMLYLWITAGLLIVRATDGAEPKSESHLAKFGTNKVHYVTAGQGTKTIVFIHGWACNAGFWREQVPALADRAKLVLIDLPGHGESDKPQVEYTMHYFADAVIAVMRDAKLKKATLVGHSMGAPIICRVYAKAPERVAGLVAVDGFMRRPKMTAEQAESISAPFTKPDYREHAKRFVDAMFPNPGTEAVRDWVMSEMLATPQHVMAGAMAGMFDMKVPAWDLTKVDVPVMSINTKSPMWTESYEKYVRGLSDKSDYRSLEGTGHFVMLEKPAEFNAALVEMLEKWDLIQKGK